MAEEVTREEVIDEVSQSEMVDDFFAPESGVEIVDDDGNPIDAEEAETEQKEENKTEDKPKEEPEKTKRTKLEEGFFGEDGNVKDEALDFFGIKDGKSFQYQRPAPPAEAEEPAGEKDDRPMWRQKFDADKEYRENLRNNLFGPVLRLQELSSQYPDATPQQLVAAVQQEYDQRMQEHLMERQYQLQYEEREQEKQSLSEKERLAEARPQSIGNQNLIAAEVGGEDKYLELMYSPELGGPILNWLFDKTNPDAKAMSKDQFNSKFNEWFTHLSSDMNDLRMVVDVAKGKLARMMAPHFVERGRASAFAQVKEQRRGKMSRSPNIAVPATEQGEGVSNEWSKYLEVDRV